MVLCLKTRESRSLPGLLSTQIINIFSIPCKTVHICAKRENNPYRIKFYHLDAGWSSPVARQAHNLKAAGSNPAPATKIMPASSGPFFYQKSEIRNQKQTKAPTKQSAPKRNVHPSSMRSQNRQQTPRKTRRNKRATAPAQPTDQEKDGQRKEDENPMLRMRPSVSVNLCSARDENNPTSEEQPR